MFSGGLAESQLEVVELKDVDGSAVESVISFSYTGRLTLSSDNVQQISEVSSLFHLAHILVECCRFLRDELDPTNCLGIAQFADMYSCQSLMEASKRYVCCHFAEMATCEEFFELEIDQLLAVLSSDWLFVENEDEIHRIALTWLLHDPATRATSTSQVMDKIRFAQLSENYISRLLSSGLENQCIKAHVQQLKSESDVLIHDEVRRKLHEMSNKSPGDLDCLNTRARRHLRDYLVATGGYVPTGDREAVLERYDPDRDTWTRFNRMARAKSALATAVLDGFLYVVGGTDGKFVFNSVQRFDPLVEVWSSDSASMISPRAYFGLIAAKGFLYAIGGWNNDCICLNSMERYDAISNRWQAMPHMSKSRHGAGVAFVEHLGQLFVCGGNDGTFTLNSVEKFDCLTEKWETIAPMTSARAYIGCCFIAGYLYVIGGNKQDASSCERLDITSQIWYPINGLQCPRPHGTIGARGLRGHLYVWGGTDRNEKTALEMFDLKSGSWSLLTSSPEPNRIDAAFEMLRL